MNYTIKCCRKSEVIRQFVFKMPATEGHRGQNTWRDLSVSHLNGNYLAGSGCPASMKFKMPSLFVGARSEQIIFEPVTLFVNAM